MKQFVALFFSAEDLQLARDNPDEPPIAAALPMLDGHRQDPLEAAHLLGLRHLFRADNDAAELALNSLPALDLPANQAPGLADLQRQLGWLSVLSMLRTHPNWQSTAEPILSQVSDAVARELEAGPIGDPLRLCWLAAVSMGAGILRVDEAGFERAAEVYRQIVAEHIHPEGYFKGIVDVDGVSDSYASQHSATRALALMAEMAGQAGLDLWAHNSRGVSVHTAATYSFYYYFYPERWRWEAGLSREQTLALMRRDGACYEMLNRRQPIRGIEQLFAEQRPMFCALAGLTSLTHGMRPPRKRRWGIF